MRVSLAFRDGALRQFNVKKMHYDCEGISLMTDQGRLYAFSYSEVVNLSVEVK